MTEAKSWCIKIRKDGQPEVSIEKCGIQPLEIILPTDDDVLVLQSGLIFKHKNDEFFCGYNKIAYKKIPTTLKKQINMEIVNIKDTHILYLFYEIISGVLCDRCSALVKKEPFDLSAIVAKYLPKYEDKLENIRLDFIVKIIPTE